MLSAILLSSFGEADVKGLRTSVGEELAEHRLELLQTHHSRWADLNVAVWDLFVIARLVAYLLEGSVHGLQLPLREARLPEEAVETGGSIAEHRRVQLLQVLV